MLADKTKAFLNGIILSYSQVFFSDNRFFALILILVSFIDYQVGLSGLIAVLAANIISNILDFNKSETEKGLYGFNSLLVGLGIGNYFAPSIELLVFIIIAAFISILLVNFLKGVLQKYGLPYLSLPFIFTLWIILLSSRYFASLGISQRGIFTHNTLYSLGGLKLVNLYESILDINIAIPLKTYFISMAAIFFQYNVFSGILISIGLLIFSRIATLFSIIGFTSAYYFYYLLGGNIAELSYSYIGFNFILTAIALGGFFLVPSFRTLIWTIFLIPVVILLTVSLSQLFNIFMLPVYALPFNMVVLLFLYTLKFRIHYPGKLTEVYFQFNNPEKNFYYYNNQKKKSSQSFYIPFRPPFHGKWKVTQAHNGDITHKGEWKHAWDFVITDEEEKEFNNTGLFTEDYYCYRKSVLSPADGTVDQVVDHIPDNEIGKYNLNLNWGNTVIIKHDEHLYSSLNHLKAGSVKVKPGDTVKSGQKIAEAGNSGRSPYPHLHFQLQSTPYIGSKTLNYPLGFYLKSNKGKQILETYNYPRKNEIVSAVEINIQLNNAFDFIPGKLFRVSVSSNKKSFEEKWEVITDEFNHSCILNQNDGSTLWFVKNQYQIYFTHFEGNKKSALYQFYLSFYNVFLAYYNNLKIEDNLPQNITFGGILLWIQDFFAPFIIFLKTDFYLKYPENDNNVFPEEIKIETGINRYITGQKLSGQKSELIIADNEIKSFKITGNNTEFHAKFIS